jgi:hypothetical protein
MADCKAIVPILVAALAATAPRDVAAQSSPGEAIPRLVQECLPPHLACRMKPIDVPENIRDKGEYGFINESKCWPAGKVLRVCFLEETDPAICRKIAGYANEWGDPKKNGIAFDFGEKGPGGKFRTFEVGDQSDIRITFRYRGLWSIVGQDSRMTIPGEPTMSLENFDIAPPDEAEFRAAVLHEFGHALGFLHQYQHRKDRCGFALAALSERFRTAADPWDSRKVKLNFASPTYLDAPILSGDVKPSVMHLPCAPWMLSDGRKSPCYVTPSFGLSEVDQEAARRAYPRGKREQNARNGDISEDLLNLAGKDTLSQETRALLSTNGALFASSDSGSPATAMSGGGGTVFVEFLKAMTELSAEDVKPEYVRGAWGVLLKSADQEGRLLKGWSDDIDSYSRRFAIMDDETQKNLDKMRNYIQFYDDFQKLSPPRPDDGPASFKRKQDKLTDLAEQGRKLPR